MLQVPPLIHGVAQLAFFNSDTPQLADLLRRAHHGARAGKLCARNAVHQRGGLEEAGPACTSGDGEREGEGGSSHAT